MGKRIIVTKFDDLEPELDADENLTFGFDGHTYEIDLCKKNADKLRKALDPFINAATKVAGTSHTTGRRKAKRTTTTGGTSSYAGLPLGEVRAWAQANNIAVSDRGRVSAEVVRAWRDATGQNTEEPATT